MRPRRGERKTGKQPVEAPEGGVAHTKPCLSDAGEDLPADHVSDDTLSKLDALEKKINELQETLDKLLPNLGPAEGEG